MDTVGAENVIADFSFCPKRKDEQEAKTSSKIFCRSFENFHILVELFHFSRMVAFEFADGDVFGIGDVRWVGQV